MYIDLFGLNRSPFDLSPDPSFMWPTSTGREAIASVTHAVAFRKGFIVLTGEVGTGKTMVVRSLFNVWKSQGIAFANIFAPRLSVIDFLIMATSDLGIRVTELSKASLLQALYGFLTHQFQKGLTTVLVIDEAHQLSTDVLEEIRMLTNVETNQQKLVQVLLVGQPELDRKLDSFELRQLKQRIAVRCQLEPLCEEETRQYIAHRLSMAGANSQSETIFPVETANIVHRYSRGIPRLINSICDHALVAASTLQVRVVPVEIIEQVASHFRLDPVPKLNQTEKPFSLADQTEKSIPYKSWQAEPSLNVPVVESSDLHESLSNETSVQTPSASKPLTSDGTSLCDNLVVLQTEQEDSTPHKLTIDPEIERKVLTGSSLEPLNGETVCSPSDLFALSGPLASITTPSKPHPPGFPQDPTLDAESTLRKPTATQLTAWEPAMDQITASVADLPTNWRSDQILQDTWSSQLRLWLGPRLRSSFLIGGASVLGVALATGVILARRQNGAGTVPHWTANASKPSPVGQTDDSMQTVGASSANHFDAVSMVPVVPRTETDISMAPGPLEYSPSRTKTVIGTLSRPVVEASHVSTSSEPPLITETQTNELLSNGLLGISVPDPTPPAPSTSENLQPPKLVSSPELTSSSLALTEKMQGVVVIDALVDATGKVTDMTVISGLPRLTQAAMQALRTWKYEPARLQGQPIAMHMKVSINFSH